MITNNTNIYNEFFDPDRQSVVIKIEECVKSDEISLNSFTIDYNLYNTIEIVGIEDIITLKKVFDAAYSYLKNTGKIK